MVSEEDKRRMRRLGEDLRALESNKIVDFEGHRALIKWMNERRAKKGLVQLKLRQDLEDPPEQELYRRAKSLGMGPFRRSDH